MAVALSTIGITDIWHLTVMALRYISILASRGCTVRSANTVISQHTDILSVEPMVAAEHLVNRLMDISGRNKI